MLKKNDLILVGIVILAVVLGFGGVQLYRSQNTADHKYALIKQGDRVIERIDLDEVKEPREIKVEGAYYDIIQVEPGRIRFKEASCPDQICVGSGWLSGKGDMAVCLPNYTFVLIEGRNEEIDGGAF